MSVKKPLCPERGLESAALGKCDRPALAGAGHGDGRAGSGAEWLPDARHHEPLWLCCRRQDRHAPRATHGLKRGRCRTSASSRAHRALARGAQ